MIRVSTTSISGLEWYQHPGNFINSQPDVLFANLHSQSPFNCASWSEDNIIAFTGPEGIYKGAQTNNTELDSLREKFLHLFQGDKYSDKNSVENNQLYHASRKTRKSSIVSGVKGAPAPVLGQPAGNAGQAIIKPAPAPAPAPKPSGEKTMVFGAELSSEGGIKEEETNIVKNEYWHKRRQVSISCLTHVIFLVNPRFPSEHTTLITPHRSRIKQIVFSPSCFGPLMLSADEADRVCVWSMKYNCTNDWYSSHSFSIPQVIAIFWIPLQMYSLPTVGEDDNEKHLDFIKKFQKNGYAVPRLKIPAFITVSANGLVNLVYKRVFDERWISVSIKIPVGGQLNHCDLIFLPNERKEIKTAYIALAGASLPNRIAIHQLSFNFDPPQRAGLSSKLFSIIPLPPLGIPPFSVIHLKFDRSHPISSLTRGLIVVTSNGSDCRISRWDINISPNAMPRCQEKVSITPEKEEQLGSSFISLLQSFGNGDIIVGYFNGKIEIRRASDLCLIQAKMEEFMQSSGANKQFKSGKHSMVTGISETQKNIIQTTGKPFTSPLCVSISPNQSGFCLVDYHSNLHIFIRDNPFFPTKTVDDPLSNSMGGENSSTYLSRAMADVFEYNMLTGICYWDVLLLFRDISSKKQGFYNSLIPCLINDFHSLNEDGKSLYYSKFQVLISRLLRNFESQIVNYIDCQSRLIVEYIYDSFFTCFKQVKISPGDLSTDAAAAFTSAKTIFEVEDGMEKSLLNLGDWVLEFSVFFLRNIFHYLKTEDLPLREDISVIRKTKSLQCFFILNAHLFPSLVPCLSLLFDQNFVKQLLILILASTAVRNKAASSDAEIADRIVRNSLKPEDISLFYTEIYNASTAIREIQLEGNEYSYKYFVHAKGVLKSKLFPENLLSRIEIMPMPQLFQKLDLDTPLLSFLEQNQISTSGKRKINPQRYHYSSTRLVNTVSRYDILTRQELSDADRFKGNVRQCSQCHRLAKIYDESIDLVLRWELCCPTCGARWKLIKADSSSN